MTASAVMAAAGTYCRNCEFFLGRTPGNFCAHCGQATALHPPATSGYLRHFAHEYLSPGGRLMRSLGLLLFRPGELTRRYLIGKRNSHIAPFRLYVATSLVFFLVVKVFGSDNLFQTDVNPAPPEVASASDQADAKQPGGIKFRRAEPASSIRKDAGEPSMETPFVKTIQCSLDSKPCNKIRAYMLEKYGDASLRLVGRQIRDRLISYAPNAMIVMLPFFALITWVLYWRRHMVYGEHLAYALHVHAFSYLLLLAIALLPSGMSALLVVAGLIYFAVAMQRVFGGRRWATTLRYALIGIGYPIALSVAILGALLAAIFT